MERGFFFFQLHSVHYPRLRLVSAISSAYRPCCVLRNRVLRHCIPKADIHYLSIVALEARAMLAPNRLIRRSRSHIPTGTSALMPCWLAPCNQMGRDTTPLQVQRVLITGAVFHCYMGLPGSNKRVLHTAMLLQSGTSVRGCQGYVRIPVQVGARGRWLSRSCPLAQPYRPRGSRPARRPCLPRGACRRSCTPSSRRRRSSRA